MAVGFSANNGFGSRDGSRSGSVFDHNSLPQRLTHARCDGAHDQIGPTSRCIGHDQANRFGREVVGTALRIRGSYKSKNQNCEPG